MMHSQDKKTELTVEELNKIYNDADSADRDIFAEQRNNILMVAGEHYSKVNKAATSVRTSKKEIESQKLRLVKNHMHRVSRTYKSNILAYAPGVSIAPANKQQLQDIKAAELNQQVYLHGFKKYKFKQLYRESCDDFVDIGESCRKIFWNPYGGEFTGQYEQEINEAGEPQFEEPQMSADDQGFSDQLGALGPLPPMQTAPKYDKSKPIFTGGFEFERVYGFNLLRHASIQSLDDRYGCWIIRKMVDTDVLKQKYAHDDEIVQKINETQDDTYIVFDANKAEYTKSKGQTLLKEYYWPVSDTYPEGYFAYAIDTEILEQGPLPFGLWPLIFKRFDEYQTSPRGRSVLKVARSFQAEINRASSQMALAQITLGDDKVLYQAGTTLQQGSLLPGVRGVAYQGLTPTVLPGRTGEQYLPYIQYQVDEMDRALMLQQEGAEKVSGQIDPFALLFRSASQQKLYGPYIDKFEEFLVDFATLYLELCKKYLPDDQLLEIAGLREAGNLKEFRNSSALCYQISVERQVETIETKFGRQLTSQHIMQYAGAQINPRMFGKLIKNMPYANWEDDFSELTADEDNARNDILALERGEMPEANEYGDPEYMVQALASRMKQPDFKFLAPQIKAAFDQYKGLHQQIIEQRAQALAAAKNEYIPVDGPLITCDMYVADPKNPDNQAKRVKIPERALDWVMQKLSEQGASLEKLQSMNGKVLEEVAQAVSQGRQQLPSQPQPNGNVQPQAIN
jgi:hypothetical protein